jgi:hypothetical protein
VRLTDGIRAVNPAGEGSLRRGAGGEEEIKEKVERNADG